MTDQQPANDAESARNNADSPQRSGVSPDEPDAPRFYGDADADDDSEQWTDRFDNLPGE